MKLNDTEKNTILPIVFKEAPFSIVVVEKNSYDSNIIVEVNDRFSCNTGLQPAEVIGKPSSYLLEMLSQESKVKFEEFIAKELSIENFENCWLDKEGNTRWALNTFRTVEAEGKVFHISMNQDITDRKEAEIALQNNYQELLGAYGQLAAMEEAQQAQLLELKEKERALSISEERFRLAAECSEQGIWDIDLANWDLVLSEYWRQRLGFEKVKINYNDYIRKIHQEDIEYKQERFDAHLTGKEPLFNAEYRIMDKDGNWLWLLSRGRAILDDKKHPIRLIGSFTDVTEMRNREEYNRYLATHDELTGLLNRRGFFETVERELAEMNTQTEKAYFVMIDIDEFKLFNSISGHSVGDIVLKEFANILLETFKNDCIIARVGGDEFILFIREGLPNFHEIKNQIDNADSFCINTGSGVNYFQSSRGVALLPEHGKSIEDIMRKAEVALHFAKSSGNNQCVYYDEFMQHKALHTAKIKKGLLRALDNNEMWVAFQPVYNINNGQICGYEALIRWDNPELGSVAPTEFIPVAEDIGYIYRIGEWVLREACLFARLVKDDYGFFPIIAVNVSAKQLRNPQFPDLIHTVCGEFGMPLGNLNIEITESSLITNLAECSKQLNRLRALGIRISLDDFGTGYSSLTYLQTLPIDTVKVDKSFTDKIIDNYNLRGKGLLTSIIQMVKQLDYSLVVEGVEHYEQYAYLKETGCIYCQGYFFSRPLRQQDALNLLR